ncbi:MAG: alcohol dehydrogenase catalytic domain-containing protein [Opitutaceae bacterium]
MLAIRIHETGGPDKLRLDQVGVPIPGAGEIRVRVEAAGVNFIDTYKRSGLYAVSLPHTIGQEAAGVVTAVGAGVTDFRVGDRVASPAVSGGYAEEAIAPAAQTVIGRLL